RKRRAFIVCGCLPNVMGEKIIERFPEVDMVFGSSDFAGIPGMLEESVSGFPKVKIHSGNRVIVREPDFIYSHSFSRVLRPT
ncbi:MAG: hypothetical protein N3E48_04730, partial [Candidatus Bathyarchaeota archaeon]|nr:hypothetical protein [Candidatus Bathyarchaeota archaeon]